MCILLKNMPKKKDRAIAKKLIPDDKKGFFNHIKTTTITNFSVFVKATSECDKDNIGSDAFTKVKAILDSKLFSDESLNKEG